MKTAWSELVDVIAGLRSTDEMDAFLTEILTPKEISDLTLRWQLLKELHAGETQRKIAGRHRISLCKITRGSKILKTDGSITKRILDADTMDVNDKELKRSLGDG